MFGRKERVNGSRPFVDSDVDSDLCSLTIVHRRRRNCSVVFVPRLTVLLFAEYASRVAQSSRIAAGSVSRLDDDAVGDVKNETSGLLRTPTVSATFYYFYYFFLPVYSARTVLAHNAANNCRFNLQSNHLGHLTFLLFCFSSLLLLFSFHLALPRELPLPQLVQAQDFFFPNRRRAK